VKDQDPRTPTSEPDASDPAVSTADAVPGATASLPVRAILVAVGTLSLGVGLIGIVVPVLPTTPFLLLAAACYARASDRLYSWLIGQPSLGPIITEWRRSRSLPPGVKARALIVIALSFGASIILVDDLPVRAILLAAALAVGVFVYRIPTRS
jgi:uncharacterized membrane protein YbaN (DUF454 family)